jgi:hypothetical protein
MQWLTRLRRRPRRCLKSFEAELHGAGGAASRFDAGIRTVPTDRIVGSLDRWRTLGPDFLPLSGPSLTERHRRIAEAMRREIPLPPLELYELTTGRAAGAADAPGEYFVIDGHHRVAMANRLGQAFLEARVVQYRIRAELPG